MGKVRAFIFDIGGVLFLAKSKRKRASKNLLSSYKELCFLLEGINLPPEEFWEQSKDIYLQSTKGDISKEKTLNSLSKILSLSPNKVEILFTKAVKKNVIENKKLNQLILKLKKRGYKTGILSIQWPLSKDILVPSKYYKIFDVLVISYVDKIRKPDPKSFKLILKKLKVQPEQAVFIDDKQENLDIAQSLRIKTILFKNNNQFLRELNKLEKIKLN